MAHDDLFTLCSYMLMYLQGCLLDRDCQGELVCLYAHTLPSSLLYISPSHPDAYTCGTYFDATTDFCKINIYFVKFSTSKTFFFLPKVFFLCPFNFVLSILNTAQACTI